MGIILCGKKKNQAMMARLILLNEYEFESSLPRMGGPLNIGLEELKNFAPWVNKVYLVTDQQKPSWLDINSENWCW